MGLFYNLHKIIKLNNCKLMGDEIIALVLLHTPSFNVLLFRLSYFVHPNCCPGKNCVNYVIFLSEIQLFKICIYLNIKKIINNKLHSVINF